MTTNTKRTRDSVNSPDKDKPADKSVRLQLCTKCKNAVSDDSIECSWCSHWEHGVCANIKETELVLLHGATSENILFICSSCLPKLPTVFSIDTTLSNKFDSFSDHMTKSIEDKSIRQLGKFEIALNNRFTHLKDELNSLSAKICTNVKEITKLDNQIKGCTPGTNDDTKLPMKSVSQLATTIITEQREKERRQTNLIFHNIDESVSKEPQIRKQHDINEVTKLLNECLNTKCSIKNALRIGKKGQRQKPHLLKITFASIEDKTAVLRNKSQLRREDVSEYIKNIYITPDLTPTEQENNKKLRQELSTLNKEGKKYMIKTV